MVVKYYILTLGLLLSLFGFSQKLEVVTQLSSNSPYINEEFQINYKLQLAGSGSFSHNGRITVDRNIPSHFTLINEGTPQRDFFSFGGGMSLAEYALVLKPNKQGQLKLPEFSFVLGDKRYKAKAQTISVGKGKDYSNRSESRNFFVELEFSETEVYKGQALTCVAKLFTKVNVRDVEVKKSEFESFKVKPLKEDNTSRKVNFGGTTYLMQEIAAYQLTPLKSGELTISPLEIIVQTVVGRGFRRSVKNNEVRTFPYKIKVKELPKPVPQGFTNAVGQFKLESKINQTEVNVNEAVNWDIIISGKGNLDILSPPNLEFDQDLEVFEPKVQKNISTNRGGTNGKVSYTYVLVPRDVGDFDLPDYKLVYFDPKQEKYITLESESTTIESQGVSNFGGEDYVVEQKKVELRNEDIRFIKTSENHGSYEGRSSLSWIVYIISAVLISLIFFFMNFGFKLSKSSKQITVDSIINKLEKVDANSTDELLAIIQDFFRVKWNIDASNFTLEKRKELYAEFNVEDGKSSQIESVIENIELSRYAGGSVNTQLKQQAIDAIKSLKG